MKKRTSTISIGIPAFNEEANIAHLLKALIGDTSKDVKLLEVIVASDGSTDKTVTRVRSVKDGRIVLLARKDRRGIVYTQNEIVKLARGNILVLLDADVMPVESNFLDRITKPIRENKQIGVVGAETIPLKPYGLFERIIANSHYMKRHLYRQIQHGNNVYLCHGRGRAFSKSVYSQIRWPDDYPEDAFSYFFCVQQGYKFVYAKDAAVYFRSPVSLSEHSLQSTRFTSGKQKLVTLFGERLVHHEYTLPRVAIYKTLLRYLYRNPFSTPLYIVISLWVRLFLAKSKKYQSKWLVARSSKKLFLYKGHKLSRI